MPTALVVSFVSIIWVALWATIFWFEDNSGQRRFLVSLRSWIDARATQLASRVQSVVGWWGAGRIRLFVHFVVHTVLRLLLGTLRLIEKRLQIVLRHNKRKAAKIQVNQEGASTYLQEVAKHKETTSPRVKHPAHK